MPRHAVRKANPTSPSFALAARALALAGVLALAGQALGQNALGDGTGLQRPLDRDLGRGVPARRPNTAAAFRQELAFRNAIVTGNAPGGASFRGDVGYVAPGEFRASLGSNDLFAFRRDSLFSGFAGLGIRGTDALQYQFALATGNAGGLLGVGAVARSGAGLSTSNAVPSTLNDPNLIQQIGQGRDPNRPVPGQSGVVDDTPATGSLMGMMRSPSSYIVNRTAQPEIMGAFTDPGTGINWGLTASSLRGIRMTRMLQAETRDVAGLTPRPGTSDNLVASPTSPTAIRPGQPQTDAPSNVLPTSYQAMVERFRAAYEGRSEGQTPDSAAERPGQTPGRSPSGTTPGITPGSTTPGSTLPGSTLPGLGPGTATTGVQAPRGTAEWEARLAAMRERLSADYIIKPPSSQNTGNTPDPEDERLAENTSAGSIGFRPLDPETLRIIRQSAATMRSYVPEAPLGDAYEEHMAVASRLMQQGAFFDAEERFTRAQASRQDDYLASIGRLHAQIGAGMYLSAGINLRRMLTEHPEVAGTKFDAAMLPGSPRIERCISELRANASQALDGRQVLLGADSALIIAYLGYQRGDERLMLEGFDLYRRLIAGAQEQPSPDQHGAALLEVIRQVWGGLAPQETP